MGFWSDSEPFLVDPGLSCPAVPTSLSSNQPLDVSGYGWTRDELPATVPPDPGAGSSGAMPAEPGRMTRSELQAWFRFGASDRTPADVPTSPPLDLEIGSGKGTFLLQQAPREPGVDFLGIEIAKAFWRHAADRLRRHGVPNARLLWHDAAAFLRAHVAGGVFRQVHIYFPDPWPKARHHKRRLIQPPFLRELHRVLEDHGDAPTGEAGLVRLATDHAEYFEWMEDAVARVPDLFERRGYEPPASAQPGEVVGSNFERKYQKEGRRFQGMILIKR